MNRGKYIHDNKSISLLDGEYDKPIYRYLGMAIVKLMPQGVNGVMALVSISRMITWSQVTTHLKGNLT